MIETNMGWAVIEVAGESHIVPIADIQPHSTDPGCPCGPVRHPGDSDVIVHNSFDGREVAERRNQ